MQAKSQDRSKHAGNDGSTRRGARFTASTKGIRLTDDLIAFCDGELAKDPEETYASLIREGLRMVRDKRQGRILIQVLSPAR